MSNKDPRKNASGCPDPTAYEAIQKITNDEKERFGKVLHTMFNICELAGYQIQGRIVLKDKNTGRIWR